jgi:Domain of unknown function (DUF4145)
MKCPHCQVEIHGNPFTFKLPKDIDGDWGVITQICPACQKLVVEIVCADGVGQNNGEAIAGVRKRFLGYPRASTRPTPPLAVSKEFAEDYIEASLVLVDSPKASAALSRRLLQHILREKAGVKHSDLAKEIDEVISNNSLPSHLAEAIDAIRNIGNFAAHPMKSTSSGEIVPVEIGEAEWTLDVLDGLFDFYFVQPELLKKKRAALDAKLADAKKPPMK